MNDIHGDIIQWKKLWQFVSGIHYGTPNADVKEKLFQVSKELVDGILHYKKPSKASEEKLQKLIKDRNQLKLQPFANKLHQYLDIDAVQSWQILCYYLVNEYRGAATALAEYISTETSMVKLLHDIWTYHTLERMVQLKVLKNMLEYFHSGTHPYSKEYREVVERMGLPALRKSYLTQLTHLIADPPSTHKTLSTDIMYGQTRVACAERRLRETNEILQILLLIVHYSGIGPEELEQLFKLFREHSFGKQQEYLDSGSEIHSELVKRITYNELALVFRTLDLSDKFDDADWIERVVAALDGPMVSLHQFPEHGPLLLVWMLFNFRLQHTVEDEDTTRRYQQLGSRAIKLGVFEYLHAIVSHPMFKDQSLTARIVRKSIFNHLGFLCQLFDADESIAHHSNIYDLLSELLTSPTIATEFCKLEDHPIRALFNISLEHFPVEFTPLSKIAYALATAGSTQNSYIQGLLENLPVYTELYTGRNQYEIRSASSTNEDEFILCHDYTPSRKINFTIARGTKLIVRDMQNQRTYVHFSTSYNYFNALHHEINELLEDAQATSTLNSERVQRIAAGLKYLAVAVRRIQQPYDITSEMVHPTEMVFDVLLKFKSVPNPPIDLLVQCMNVCTALVPLFEQEIYTRIINLNILPSINNANLTYQEYANGVGYDSSLVGYYLMNVERSAGRYPLLMAYFNFLKTYTKLGRNNVFGVELPGAIFLLREVLPHANNWRYATGSDRYRVLVFVVQYIYEILQLSEDKLDSDYARRVLRDTCVYSLLNRDNGLVLLRIVGLGNGYLQAVMERESNWMLVPEQQLNLMIQHSMTILMQILRLKKHIHEYDLSPLESAIYTQPKQRDTLRIIPMVTGYMSNIFNPRLPILSCRLLRRFAIEFRMSLLACLDMEPDQIRHTFLERLHDEIESDDLKLAVLEFVESCVHKQPGLTEAFFKVYYGKPDRRLLLAKDGSGPAPAAGAGTGGKGRPKTMINDGIPTYMEEFLEAISNDPVKLASPLLSRIMSLFHALWKNNMQALVTNLLQKPNFWSSLCNPLFSDQIASNMRSYSQLFNILGIELFRINSAAGIKMDPELAKVFERFTQTYDIFARWVDIVVDLPDASRRRHVDKDGSEGNASHSGGWDGGADQTPDWLGRLQSFKDLLVLIVRKKEPGISLPDRCKTYLAERLLAALVERVEHVQDMRPLIVLSELYLIVLSDFDHKYTEDLDKDDEMLIRAEKLLSLLTVSYADIHQRAKEAMIAIGIKTVEIQADRLLVNYTTAAEITRSAVDIAGEEIHALELAIQAHGLKAKTGSETNEAKQYNSLLLAINLLKQLTISFDQPGTGSPTVQANSTRWVSWLVKGKLFQRLLSITGTVLPEYGRRKLVTELLNLLILLAESQSSEELLYSDVGDYLWLKLLPPKELLQRPYVMANETQQQWQTQDWWPIYSKGIHLVRALLSKHGYRFLRDAIFFVGIHEEYLMDSLMLAKQSLEPSAFVLILETLQLLCTMVPYEKEWRLEHSQSMLNLMRCTQFLMDHCISLLYRPKILKRLTTGMADNVGFIVSDLEMDPSAIDTSDELVDAMNNLIEIVSLCAKCLLCFSPPLLALLCDVEFVPSQWCPLIEIQFGAPKLSTDNYSQLSFGSLLQAVCIFTKVLNLQHYSFSETPLNELPASEDAEQGDATDGTLTMGLISRANRSALGGATSPASSSDVSRAGKRAQFSKTLSMTSVSSYTSNNAITLSNELLTHLDSKRCVCALEYVLTLLTSQSLFALKDTNLSQREKQLIKRELSSELLIFHDFVKKRILKDAKCILSRKKHGTVPIINDPYASLDDDNVDADMLDRSSSTTASERSKASQQTKKQTSSTSAQHSMRINVVRKMHLQHQQQQHQDATEQAAAGSVGGGHVMSPITGPHGQEFGRSSSTPVLRGILKPSSSASIKRVMFDDGLNSENAKSIAYVEPEDEPIFFEPQEPRFTGLSHVQMVEEDYIHLLSNVLLMIGQSET